MRLMTIISIIFLFIFISFGTIGGCGGGNGDGESNGNGNEGLAGETNCMDGIDNDGDTEIDCADIDCILDPNCDADCEDFINALCERRVECNAAMNFENCVDFFELFSGCDEFFEALPDPNQCIADLDNFDCEALNEDTLLPDTCTPVGACNICETDEDCPEGLVCSMCFEGLFGMEGPTECTGVVDRCAPFSFFFVDCGDGFFRTQQ